MKQILVPVDFSPASHNASEYAALLAHMYGAQVYLLHVFSEQIPVADIPSSWITLDSAIQVENDKRINKAVVDLASRYAITAEGSAVVGITGDAIVYIANEINADLIVMGMKSDANKFFGSAVYSAIRKSKVPVLVVPEGVKFAAFKHIIFATDLEQIDNNTCLLPLFEILRKSEAELHVLHIRRDSAEDVVDVPGNIQLGRMLSRFSYGYDEIKDASVEHGIGEFVESHPADLLVMIAHRHNIFSWLFGKIYTKNVSKKTVLPLLVLEDKHK